MIFFKVVSDSSNKDEMVSETTKQRSLHKIPSLSDSDSSSKLKTNVTKRCVLYILEKILFFSYIVNKTNYYLFSNIQKFK